VVHLNSLLDRHGPNGLRIVALSMMPAGDVESLYVKEHKARYSIGCDMRLETLVGFVRPNEVAACPHGFLVGVDGRVVAQGETVPDDLVAKALEDYFDPSIGRELHASLAAARADYEKGAIGKAWAAASRSEADADAAVAADAKHLRERCDAHAAFARRQAEKQLAAGDVPAGAKLLDDVAKRYAGMEAATWAAQRKRDLAADPTARRELAAWQELERVDEKERKAGTDPKKREAVDKAYRALVKKYAGPAAAAEAHRRLVD
jgi:hypothetical protein